jgi:Ni/Fe-hydrogenase subunit HybB-like protein
MPDKIHPLWFTPILPLLFFLSAVAVGPAMVIIETSLGSKGLGHHVDLEILAGLGRALTYVLGLYLVVRLGDLLLAGELGLIFSSGLYSVLFLVVLGLVLNRFNVSLIALAPRPGTVYFPHPMEFAISIAIVSAGVLAYILANRYLPIVQHEYPVGHKSVGETG